MWRQITSDALTQADLPTEDANWDALSAFALSYYCHTDRGSQPGYEHRPDPPSDGTVDDLRAWLFFEQRAIRGGYVDDPDDARLIPMRNAIESLGTALTLAVPSPQPIHRWSKYWAGTA